MLRTIINININNFLDVVKVLGPIIIFIILCFYVLCFSSFDDYISNLPNGHYWNTNIAVIKRQTREYPIFRMTLFWRRIT